MADRLNGKIAIVTGGASGVGAAISRRFAAEGARVVIADRDLNGAEALAAEIAQDGGEAAACVVDVSDGPSMSDLVAFTLRTYGGLNVMVNNAGAPQKFAAADGIEEPDYDRLYDVNAKSIYWCARHAVPVMVKNGGGSVVNTASVSAVRPRPGNTWYAGSKAAAVVTTRALALEYALQNVRFNAINPGPIETPLLHKALSGHGDAAAQEKGRLGMISTVPMGRLGQPEEVANAALFLASDEASFITGVCLEVDGGRGV